jgi:hypothetical protein
VVVLVVRVRVLLQVGKQGLLVKLWVTPVGKPDTAKLTGCDVPERRVRVIVTEPLCPAVTVRLADTVRL